MINEKPSSQNQPLVLLIEDDENSARYLFELLKKSNLRLVHFENGKDGLEYFNKNQSSISFILLDIKLPDISGFEVIKEIRKINKEIPVVIETAHAFDFEKQLGYDAGCNFYLTKPINKDAFYEVINSILP